MPLWARTSFKRPSKIPQGLRFLRIEGPCLWKWPRARSILMTSLLHLGGWSLMTDGLCFCAIGALDTEGSFLAQA